MNQLKDKLDIIERGIEPDLAGLSSIADALERLANTLVMLDLNKLASVSREEAANSGAGKKSPGCLVMMSFTGWRIPFWALKMR